MSVQLLDKTRKINKLLHNNNSHKVVFNDICKVLSEILLSNILVISKKGKVLGVGLCPGVDEIEELIEDQVGGFVDRMLNERLLSILSTKENVNLATLGFADENVKKYIKQIWYIDDTDIKYFKIFSLYCMEYDPSTNFFLKPNPKMCEFGDTAVIIADYNEFIERFGKALFKKYDSVVSMMDRVKFYNFRETRETNPLFEKHEKYSYQNELRMAFCELRENKFAMGINSDTSKEIVEDLTPVKLQIGNIRDIAYAIPIENFLKLLIPRYIPLRFPMRELYESQSNYDKLVSNTRSVMKNHKSPFVRPMLVIDGNARVTDEGILI